MILGLIIGIVSAGFGAAVIWRLGRPSANRAIAFQKRIAESEEDKAAREAIDQFVPWAHAIGEPPNQYLRVESNAIFQATEMEYLTGAGASAARQNLELKGKVVDIPIDESKVGEVQRLGQNPQDGSAPIQLRVHMRVGEIRKTQTVPGQITIVFQTGVAGDSTTYARRKVTA